MKRNVKSLDTLTLGGLCSSISLNNHVWNKLKAICLKYPIPIPKVNFTIPNNVYINVPCYVPKNQSTIYTTSETWRPFFNIIETDIMDNIDGLQNMNIYTTSDFINYEGTSSMFVFGYIVGACSTSIEYADFEAPFEWSSAILLADKPDETDIEKMISIELKAGNNRDKFNLKDHPENKNKLLSCFGYKIRYLGIPGIKGPTALKLLIEYENTTLTNIENRSSEKENPIQYYNIAGEKLNTLQKGINIVRYSNGDVKKIVKK